MTCRPLRFAPLLALAAAACAADDATYPSLAPRAVEKLDLGEPAAEPDVTVPADPILDAAIARAVAARIEAARRFDQVAAKVERQARAARGSAAGSTAWLDAQVALAGLDEARGQHASAVEVLDDLAAERAGTLAAPYPALETALGEARAAAEAQTRRTDAIAALLPAG